MLPGINRVKESMRTKPFGLGSLVAILVGGNSKPVALGVAAMSSEAIYSSNATAKGRALTVVHYFGDGLWQLGSRCIPPGFSFAMVEPVREDMAPQVIEEPVSDSQPNEQLSLSKTDVDNLIVTSFLFVAKSLIDSDLPMHASSVFSRIQTGSKSILSSSNSYLRKQRLEAVCGSSLEVRSRYKVDLKNSSFGQLKAFIRHLSDLHLVKSKLVRGDLMVISVNFDILLIKQFTPPPPTDVVQSVPLQTAPGLDRVTVSTKCSLDAKWRQAFPAWDAEGTKQQLVGQLTAHLKTMPGDTVALSDAALVLALGKASSKKECMQKFSSDLITLYSLSTEVPPRTRRGLPPKTSIKVRKIQGNKFCTEVRGLGPLYKLDEGLIATRMAKLFAVTASLTDGAIYCQGNLADKLGNFLVDVVGIPSDCIDIHKPS